MDVQLSRHSKKWNWYYGFGLVLASLIIIVSIYLWQYLQNQETSNIQQQLNITSKDISQRLAITFTDYINLVERLAARWEAMQGISEKVWQQDVNAIYVHGAQAFKNIQWVNNDYRVQRVIPTSDNIKVNDNYAHNTFYKALFSKAAASHKIVLSDVINLGAGRWGIVTVSALQIGNKHDGYLVTTLDLSRIINKILLNEITTSYGIAIYQYQPIYTSGVVENIYLVQQSQLQVLGKTWQIYIWPTQQFYYQMRSFLPEAILISGIIIACLLVIMLYEANLMRLNSLRLAKVENEKTKTLKYLTAILQTVDEGFITIDKNSIILEWNPHAEQMFGWTKEEAVGLPLYELIIPPAYRGEHLQGITQYIATGKAIVFNKLLEMTALNRAGLEFPIELVIFPLSFSNTVTFHAFIRDISDRKLAQAEQARLASIVGCSDDAIISTDSEGKITSWNQGAYKLFGYTAPEVMHLSLALIFTDEQVNTLSNLMGRIKQGEHIHIHDMLCKNKVGEQIPISILIVPFKDDKDKIIGSASIIRDISERKKIEKLKNEFISIVSHELRTPLTAIRGALGLLGSNQVSELSSKGQQLVEIASNNSDRLIRLINDILDIEKIESGKMEFKFKLFDLNKLLMETIASQETLALKQNIQIHLLAADKYLIKGDYDRLMQVGTNLLSNAIRYTPSNGHIDVKVEAIAKKIRVSFIDQGPGVPKEFAKKIFGKFAQADSSATRKSGGTGLGLNISKAIIEKHDGAIGYSENPQGPGSIFYFELPLEQADLLLSAEKKLKVLICDNNIENANILYQYLKSNHIEADIAYTAIEAKQILTKHDYQAIIMDFMLPDADGMAFIKSIRAQNKYRYIPIVIASVEMNADEQRIHSQGFPLVDWIEKPIDEGQLEKLSLYLKTYFSNKIPNILSVEDDTDITRVISMLLQNKANVWNAKSIAKAQELLSNQEFDLVVLDLNLPDGDGTALLPCLNFKTKFPIPVIVFSVDELQGKYMHLVKQVLLKSKATNMQLYNAIEAVIETGK